MSSQGHESQQTAQAETGIQSVYVTAENAAELAITPPPAAETTHIFMRPVVRELGGTPLRAQIAW